jgi:tRNA(fMet)-specific endonuclease VapC
MRYMLDTNTCTYLIKHHPPGVKQRVGTLSVGEVAVSSVVIAEFWYGIVQSTKKKHNEAALEDFLKYVTILDWPMQAAPEYGRIWAHLKKKGTRGAARDGRIFEERGTPIGAMDLLIAAHAVTLDVVLVTDNVREFGRVPRLCRGSRLRAG